MKDTKDTKDKDTKATDTKDKDTKDKDTKDKDTKDKDTKDTKDKDTKATGTRPRTPVEVSWSQRMRMNRQLSIGIMSGSKETCHRAIEPREVPVKPKPSEGHTM